MSDRRRTPSRPGTGPYTSAVDFALTDEQREIQALAREFADTEIAPHAADVGPRPPVSRGRSSRKLGELGLMGVCVPEELGGAGADFVSYVLVLEELSRADAGVGVTVAVHTSAATLPDRRVRHRGAEGAIRPATRARRGDRRVRAHRAGVGLGRGRAPDDRRA